nr:DUF3822 family protein [uncultured Flavobacterium sp.]
MTGTKFKKLIIQVSLQNFTFCVKNQFSNEISHFKSIPINTLGSLEDQLETIFSQNELLQVNYDDILILHENNLNTFVPDTYFDERALGSYLQFNTKVFSTDYFTYDELELYKMKNVYVPYVAYNNFFIDQFGAFNYKHLANNLVEYVLFETNQKQEKAVYCNVSNNQFELVVSENGKLILFNSFEIQTPEDFIYYILFTYEQLKLNPENTPIYLFGSIEKDDLNYQMIYNYIRNVQIIEIDVITEALVENKEQFKNNFILLHS